MVERMTRKARGLATRQARIAAGSEFERVAFALGVAAYVFSIVAIRLMTA